MQKLNSYTLIHPINYGYDEKHQMPERGWSAELRTIEGVSVIVATSDSTKDSLFIPMSNVVSSKLREIARAPS